VDTKETKPQETEPLVATRDDPYICCGRRMEVRSVRLYCTGYCGKACI